MQSNRPSRQPSMHHSAKRNYSTFIWPRQMLQGLANKCKQTKIHSRSQVCKCDPKHLGCALYALRPEAQLHCNSCRRHSHMLWRSKEGPEVKQTHAKHTQQGTTDSLLTQGPQVWHLTGITCQVTHMCIQQATEGSTHAPGLWTASETALAAGRQAMRIPTNTNLKHRRPNAYCAYVKLEVAGRAAQQQHAPNAAPEPSGPQLQPQAPAVHPGHTASTQHSALVTKAALMANNKPELRKTLYSPICTQTVTSPCTKHHKEAINHWDHLLTFCDCKVHMHAAITALFCVTQQQNWAGFVHSRQCNTNEHAQHC